MDFPQRKRGVTRKRSKPLVEIPPPPQEIPLVDRAGLTEDWASLSNSDILLNRFDMDIRYGPCADISRTSRFNRATSLGLNPPEYISLLIKQTEHGDRCRWHNEL